MKRILLIPLLVLVFLAVGLPVRAQPKGKPDSTQTPSGAERVQALRVAFITDRLSLSPAEAEKFWPIYREYQDKREVIRKQLQADYKKVRDQADQMTDDELRKIADEEISLKQQDMNLQVEMHNKLKAVLPPKKLAQLYVAEEDFKKELIRRMTEDNQKPPPPKGGNK